MKEKSKQVTKLSKKFEAVTRVQSDFKGITLIALIITIIVMLLLVGVTVTVAINGGLFTTAKKSSYQTEVRIIQEQLETVKAKIVAENKGMVPSDFEITMSNLGLSSKLEEKYENKLIISNAGVLYYNPETVENAEERAWLEEIGIYAYKGNILSKDWVFSSTGEIIYYKGPEVEKLVIPSQIDGTKINKIGDYALCAYPMKRNEDFSPILDENGFPVIDEEKIKIDENGDIIIDGVTSKIKEIAIEDGIGQVGLGSFLGCMSLETVSIPKSLGDFIKDIVSDSNIKNVILQEGITNIGNEAFHLCENLVSVEIPETVTNIGDEAFRYCSSLKNINIPNSVTNIGESAFENCFSLVSVNLPEGLTRINNSTFWQCESLKNINIPNSVTYIGGYSFIGCSSLESVCIPNGVTRIEKDTFSGCTNLSNVEIPNGVTTIGEQAFYNCSSLSAIDFPDHLTSLGNWAFGKCTSIKRVELPESLSYIGSGIPRSPFDKCTSLMSIEVDENNEKYSSDGGVLFNKDKTVMKLFPAGKTGEYRIPDNVNIIDYNAFSSCTGITRLEIPMSVTKIRESSFSECLGLTDVYLEHMEPPEFGSYCFYRDATNVITFHLKNEDVYDALKRAHYATRDKDIFKIE